MIIHLDHIRLWDLEMWISETSRLDIIQLSKVARIISLLFTFLKVKHQLSDLSGKPSKRALPPLCLPLTLDAPQKSGQKLGSLVTLCQISNKTKISNFCLP